MKRTRLPNLSGDDGFSASRATLYMRVSTGRQAEHDLSIPDQRSQLRSWCRAKGYEVVAEFVELGASAGDDRRAVFQQMIERGCDGEHAFGLIVVHSYSRFFRVNASRSSNLSMMRRKATRPLPLGSVICRDSCV